MKKKSLTYVKEVLCIGLTGALLAGCSGAPAQSAASSEVQAESESQEVTNSPEPEMDYSAVLDDNGFLTGIHALDFVTLPADYKNIQLPEEVVTVARQAIDEELEYIKAAYHKTEPDYEKVIEKGDKVNIDYVGSVDGVEFEGGNTHGFGTTVTAGSMAYIDDFLDQIIGHKPGETINVEVTFPDPYSNPDLAGKDALFVTTINYVEKTVDSELDDSFVAEVLSNEYDGASTVDELIAVIESDCRSNQIAEWYADPEGFMALCTYAQELPEMAIQYEEDKCIANYKYYAKMYDMDLDQFLATYMGAADTEEFLDSMSDSVNSAVKFSLLSQALAEAEGVNISTEDVGTYMFENEGAADYSTYEDYYGLPYLKNIVMRAMMKDLVLDGATK